MRGPGRTTPRLKDVGCSNRRSDSQLRRGAPAHGFGVSSLLISSVPQRDEPRRRNTFAVEEAWSLPLHTSSGQVLANPTSKGEKMNDNGQELDNIFARIEEEEARVGKAGTGAQDVVQAIADSDGLVLVDELLREGHSKPAITAALLPPGSDGRSKPRVKAGVIDGQRLLWLTSSGWASVGQGNRREAPPTSSRVQHRLSIPRFASWVEHSVASKTLEAGIFWKVALGSQARDIIEVHKQAAWSMTRLNMNAELARTHAQLLGGVYPDLIVVSNLPEEIHTPDGASMSRGEFRDAFHGRALSWQDPAVRHTPETISAIEIELSAKSSPALDAKVRQHDAALEAGWWHEVVWVIDDDDVRVRLQRSGVGSRRGHCLVDAADVGVTSTPLGSIKSDWWPALTFSKSVPVS